MSFRASLRRKPGLENQKQELSLGLAELVPTTRPAGRSAACSRRARGCAQSGIRSTRASLAKGDIGSSVLGLFPIGTLPLDIGRQVFHSNGTAQTFLHALHVESPTCCRTRGADLQRCGRGMSRRQLARVVPGRLFETFADFVCNAASVRELQKILELSINPPICNLVHKPCEVFSS